MSSMQEVADEGQAQYDAWLEEQATGLKVVMWEWRDGSIHAEMRLATFGCQAVGRVRTHLDGASGGPRFTTACGQSYWATTNSVGLGSPATVDCPTCRSILRDRVGLLVKEAD